MTDEKKRELTPSETAVNWAKACGIILPLVGAATVSVLGWFKSNDAQGDVTSLIQQLDKRVAKQEQVINVQSEKLEKMLRRMIFFQAQQEGVSSGRLLEKNEQLEKQLAEWKAKKIPDKITTERIVEILKGSAQPSPATKSAPSDTLQQQLPRIKSKPFKRAE